MYFVETLVIHCVCLFYFQNYDTTICDMRNSVIRSFREGMWAAKSLLKSWPASEEKSETDNFGKITNNRTFEAFQTN